MTTPRFIVLSGLPGSGKSTLAAPLAEELDLPWLNKDAILEALFDSLGTGDPAWRERLSRAADEVLYSLATHSHGAVLDNWWHHDVAIERLSRLPGQTVEVFCDCPSAVAVRRFNARRRHPGHLDEPMDDAHMLAWCAEVERSYPGPLGLNGPLIRVNTALAPDIAALAADIRRAAPG